MRVKFFNGLFSMLILPFLLFSFKDVASQAIQDAVYALRNEQPEKAKGILLKMLSSNPADAETNYRLGNLYYSLGKRDSSSYYFQNGTKPEDKVNYNFEHSLVWRTAGLPETARDWRYWAPR